ncbi:MAG: tetratricopeptide repeat protein, partial [Sedimentisphaerales bacterium]|nr:tetratricopeptide repeat protein [Sedimentisphaerales bacterium]
MEEKLTVHSNNSEYAGFWSRLGLVFPGRRNQLKEIMVSAMMIIKKMMMLALICLLAGTVMAQSAAPAESASVVLHEAEQAFTQANNVSVTDRSEAAVLYERAIEKYQRLIDEFGISNEHVYYNIANAWLLQGDVGRAIVNYRRAALLAPGNADIAGNLNYARSLRLDRIPVPVEEKVMEMLFFWHYDFSLKGRYAAALVCWFLVCVVVSVMLLMRKKNTPALAISGILLLVTLLLTGSVVWESMGDSQNGYGVIVAQNTIARQGDGDN